MKRTTIMIEEELLYDLKHLAKQQGRSTSSVIREALANYVTQQHEDSPPDNPLLLLAGIGASAEPTDMSDGKDEEILRSEIHPIYGWNIKEYDSNS